MQKTNPRSTEFFDILYFNESETQTIYLIGPYNGKLRYLYIFIKKMEKRGYRVVYLQPHPEVLSHTNPQYLGQAVKEACSIIKNDSKDFEPSLIHLVGVSLGSYLGLNIQLEIPFKRFVIVAGGAPLRGVFNSTKLFKKFRSEIGNDKNKKAALDYHWKPYDEAYKKYDLTHSSTLLINSKSDRVIHKEPLDEFLKSYKETGVRIVNRHAGRLNHVLQAISINWRAKEIDHFLRS